MERSFNRKLLVSVFDAAETREAILGGGRIIDSEDPKSALGNIKPRQIQDISSAALDFKRDLEVQLSTNIGEDQLLFHRTDAGRAVTKSTYEMAGKAAQAALGVAAAMGTAVHPVNIVKVGVDAMPLPVVAEILGEIVATLRRDSTHRQAQVMAVFFAQDLHIWQERRTSEKVRRELVAVREYYPSVTMGDNDLDFDLASFATYLIGPDGSVLFPGEGAPSLADLVSAGALPTDAESSWVRLNELVPHQETLPAFKGSKTDRTIVKAMVDTAADAGCTGIMLDTQVQTKVSETGLVDTGGSNLIDLNRFDKHGGFERRGILGLEDLRFFVSYAHYRGLLVNFAGSVASYQAQQLWLHIPEVDQMATRGSASGVVVNPATGNVGSDTRQAKAIRRTLVRGLAPPEQAGQIVLPQSFDVEAASRDLILLREATSQLAAYLGLPAAQIWLADEAGSLSPYSDDAGVEK